MSLMIPDAGQFFLIYNIRCNMILQPERRFS